MAGNYTSVNTVSLLDGVDISTMNANIESVQGFLDLPERKESLKFSWPDYHGIDIDLSQVRIAERKCSMNLIVKGSSYQILASNVKAILNALNTSGYHYLKLHGIDGIFLVYVSGLIAVQRLNRGVTTQQLARMVIPFTEPYPIKFMFYANETSVGLNITTMEPVTIDWGDNQFNSLDGSGSLTHDYDTIGEYCITVYGGAITGITGINCEEITGLYSPGLEGGGPTESMTTDDTTVTVDDTHGTVDEQ
jgi:hypothetical protein